MLKTIVRNTALLSLSQLAARGIGFLYLIFLARILGLRNFGIYSFIIAFIYNFSSIADFGLERYILRDISRFPEKSKEYLAKLLPLRVFLGLLAYLLALVFAVLAGQTAENIIYLVCFGLSLLPNSLIFLFATFLNAKEKMQYQAGANLALIILTAFLGGFFAYFKFGLLMVLLAYSIANFLVFIYFLINLRRWGISIGWQVDLSFWKESLRQSWVFGLLLILAVFYLRLATIMVNFFQGPEATGLYSSASRFIEALILIPQSLALAVFPLTSKLINEDKSKLRAIYQKGLLISFLASLPFVLLMTFGSRLITTFAYGASYLPAIPVFIILGFSLGLFFLNSLPGTIIQNSGKVKKFLPFAVVNFLVALVLCLILIPRLGIVGAAWAMVGGELAGLFINNYFVYKILYD